MAPHRSNEAEVVITGMGVVSPIGVGIDEFWSALSKGRGGVRPMRRFDAGEVPVRIAAEVVDFDPKLYVRPRKSLKLMSRDTQFAVAAAAMAAEHARFEQGIYDPRRVGVVMGADCIRNEFSEGADGYRSATANGRFSFEVWAKESIWEGNPLMMLKCLPNMVACHVSIAQNAEGPNNTIHDADVSSLLAVGEAARAIERGIADAMFAGGASSRMHPLDWTRSCLSNDFSQRNGALPAAPRPFDVDRDGQVRGEGGAVFLLERRTHAERRGATILARVLGWGAAFRAHATCDTPETSGLGLAITAAIQDARIRPRDLGHVNAHGLGTVKEDILEAQALASVVPTIPVTALKSYFGNIFTGGGAVEMAGSVLALENDVVPMTLNHDCCDPCCPIDVVHGEPRVGAGSAALLTSETPQGQAVAMVLGHSD